MYSTSTRYSQVTISRLSTKVSKYHLPCRILSVHRRDVVWGWRASEVARNGSLPWSDAPWWASGLSFFARQPSITNVYRWTTKYILPFSFLVTWLEIRANTTLFAVYYSSFYFSLWLYSEPKEQAYQCRALRKSCLSKPHQSVKYWKSSLYYICSNIGLHRFHTFIHCKQPSLYVYLPDKQPWSFIYASSETCLFTAWHLWFG